METTENTTTQNQRQQLIEQFHQRSGLNREISEDTLKRFGWDLDVKKKKKTELRIGKKKTKEKEEKKKTRKLIGNLFECLRYD